MKKIIRKLTVLICVTTILIMPSASALASTTSEPVLYYSSTGPSWDYRYWLFQPEPLDILNSQTVVMKDTVPNLPYFIVPAGQQFSFGASLVNGSVIYEVYQIGHGNSTLVRRSFSGGGNLILFSAPILSYDCAYTIYVTALDSNAQISNYDASWYY